MNRYIPMNELTKIVVEGDIFKVDSRIIAKNFEKDHRHVLRDIDNLIAQIDVSKIGHISESYFVPAKYADVHGRVQRFYDMTFRGFILLTMGFTGEKAFAWKLKYIDTFEWLRQEYLKKLKVPEHPFINLATMTGLQMDVFERFVPDGMTLREGAFRFNTDFYKDIIRSYEKGVRKFERKQARLKQKKLESSSEVED